MINPHKSFNINDYIEIFLRRKWFVIIPFFIILLAAVVHSFTAPKRYRASTLILVTPQKVPEQFVRPTVTSRIEDRLQSIGQEIMSRTRLEQVIAEFKLYEGERKALAPEEVIELMRKDVQVEIKGREGFFTVSYMGKDPRTVTIVTNKLASLFIEENLRLREQQAQGTTEFLAIELNATKEKLQEKETLLSQFKRQFIYELPEQRQTNLNILDNFQKQLQTIGDALKSAQDRKLIMQKQLTDMKNMASTMAALLTEELDGMKEAPVANSANTSLTAAMPKQTSSPKTKIINPYTQQLDQLKSHLAELTAKYTEKHPDIVTTKKRVADLEQKSSKFEANLKEAEEKKSEGVEEKDVSSPVISTTLNLPKEKKKKDRVDAGVDPFAKEMEVQLATTDLEIQRLRAEEARIKAQIAQYQVRVENAPVREMAMANLARDYQNLKETYESLLKKNQEAQQAENLERRQKGEQFKVIDPARIPEKPFSPNIPRILFMGLLLGVGSGFGMAFFREQMDRSFRDAEDLEAALGFKVLANIPKLQQKKAA